MTQYNGQYGCIMCEEAGESAAQGRGTNQSYPYRPQEQRAPLRTSEQIKADAVKATNRSRIKGVIGPSGLSFMPWYGYAKMTVPDYMHGCLLGVTKTLMQLWFSPTNRAEPFFIGSLLKEIAKDLSALKPPDFIERLPRDLEKHFSHFKASEYHAWLLFYGIPCLKDRLPEQ
eukprot:Seg8607.1 transcript_id=Seg8607.1/GoldUCD/mRNA.D3Y31 product="hypothetical protein" protein_id=Seg8607.1/GoldUCD/D3Y31